MIETFMKKLPLIKKPLNKLFLNYRTFCAASNTVLANAALSNSLAFTLIFDNDVEVA